MHHPQEPFRLALPVALLAAAMMLVEIMATRIFSVLFFYHYSFFAVSLVMSGLALGGILAARWDIPALSEGAFAARLAWLANFFALGAAAALAAILAAPIKTMETPSTLMGTALRAAAFLPGLTAAGAFLAASFARGQALIGRLYAADLAAAAAACVAAIFAMRIVQGPAMLLLPALIAALAAWAVSFPATRARAAATTISFCCLAVICAHATGLAGFLRLPIDPPASYERWNEHSRITVFPIDNDATRMIVIDKTAATYMQRVPPRGAGEPIRPAPWWDRSISHLAYRLGRPVREAAIIGVGGGQDMLAPLAHGAARVDGYELNGILIDLMRRRFAGFFSAGNWPEVNLIHGEARVGIARSDRRYDVIQASHIDTWAATANGGLVLSENGLYTVEGWKTFLSRLNGGGLLTMTRWFIPDEPAEAQRLVALAGAALQEAGVPDARDRIALAINDDRISGAAPQERHVSPATIIVSMIPFTANEIQLLREICARDRFRLLLAPGVSGQDPALERLLDPAARAEAIAQSPFDISPPTDMRPYFFLQMRPRDFMRLFGKRFGDITQITFNGVRVMGLLCALSLAFTAAVAGLAARALPRSGGAGARASHLWLTLYFLSIGLGYILIQLGLHQRLIILLGHPTYALSVLLFSMLLGSGAGSAASARLFSNGGFALAWGAMLAVLAAAWIAMPALSALDGAVPVFARVAVVAAILGLVGFVLGFGFPLGVRLAAGAGERAVQKMWAVNGAASIAGSALAALIGVAWGSRAVVFAGLVCYALAALAGLRAGRANEEAS